MGVVASINKLARVVALVAVAVAEPVPLEGLELQTKVEMAVHLGAETLAAQQVAVVVVELRALALLLMVKSVAQVAQV